MKIYTRAGDGGDTGLQGGTRVSKSHPRIAAYGAVDEANSALGVAMSRGIGEDLRGELEKVQSDLFIVGADLSNPAITDDTDRVSKGMISRLESSIDTIEAGLDPLDGFILPGGSEAAAALHHARAVTRRAESLVVKLSDLDEINANCITYLNRLSDLLFVAARLENRRAGVPDVPWKRE